MRIDGEPELAGADLHCLSAAGGLAAITGAIGFMPQNLTCRVHLTVTAALSDLNTISISGDTENQVLIKNNGPGVVWISFDPATTASVAGTACYGIKTGESLTRTHVYRNQPFTFMADTASTIVTISTSAYP